MQGPQTLLRPENGHTKNCSIYLWKQCRRQIKTAQSNFTIAALSRQKLQFLLSNLTVKSVVLSLITYRYRSSWSDKRSHSRNSVAIEIYTALVNNFTGTMSSTHMVKPSSIRNLFNRNFLISLRKWKLFNNFETCKYLLISGRYFRSGLSLLTKVI